MQAWFMFSAELIDVSTGLDSSILSHLVSKNMTPWSMHVVACRRDEPLACQIRYHNIERHLNDIANLEKQRLSKGRSSLHRAVEAWHGIAEG